MAQMNKKSITGDTLAEIQRLYKEMQDTESSSMQQQLKMK